ncbi:MAG: tape measure protein [Acidovorax sp.]|uniref:tape measure protein n=1 Tax=Acidovorax sp. TaxID=1872122 RepID=UPI0039E21BF3
MTDKQISTELRMGVSGRESITGLADDLDSVAKVLDGDMKTAATAAAAQLRELAQQDAAIKNFSALEREARQAGQALKAAEKEAANYAAQVGRGALLTKEEADGLVRLQARVKETKAAYDQHTTALKGAQAELTRFGISAKDAGSAQQRLQQQVDAVRDAVQELVPAHQAAAAGAASAGDSMVRTHRNIGEGVSSISTQLARVQRLFVAFQGLQAFQGVATDLAATADQVNNLQGRLKLVTGEGESFANAWQGVTEVALRTHSALEETGTLFAKLVQAGKDAGQSTADASASALGLTETINQAIQLSGASAQASSAAITQLVQGLQGGVLRGDEFNSIMEQSPRLARALADGLGVTTGELRKMAEAGALTSETVIGALKGQSETVATEFSKLPPTVGRAMQDLSTQWSLYVAETDKATGASAAAATAISALANNLNTVGGLLLDAGQAVAAFTALRLAQHFLGIGEATKAAAMATAQSTAATVANTAAARANAAATAAAAGAVQDVGAKAGAAAGLLGRFGALLGGIQTFALVTVAANFKDIGTWVGEAAAKLMGYKDRTEELARAEQVQVQIAKDAATDRARLAAATQAAIDKQFELSKAARSAVAEFDVLTKAGTSSAEAVKKITEGFDLGEVQGVKDFAATLDKLAADGKVSATEFEAAWAQALSGKDLAQFEITARAAFGATVAAANKASEDVRQAIAAGVAGVPLEELRTKAAVALGAVGRDGERIAQVMDGIVREAVRRTGMEYEQLQGRVGAASRSAINDVEAIIVGLDRLKADGVDAGRALAASFTRAIDTADSQAAIDTLRARIESMRKALGDKITDGLLDQAREKADALRDALDKATPGINGAREAMKLLGITSDEALKKTAASTKDAYDTLAASGTASARELGEGFKKAAAAAIAANDGIAPAWVQTEASLRGYRVAADEAGKSTLELARAQEAAGRGAGNAAGGVDKLTNAMRRQGDEMERLNKLRAGRVSSTGQELGEGVTEVGSGGDHYRNKDGFTSDAKGNVQQQFVWTRTAVIDYLKQAGLDEKLAERLSKDFVNSNGNVPYIASAAQKKWGGRYGTLSTALGKMAEYYKYGHGKLEAEQFLNLEKTRDAAPAPAPAPAAATAGAGAGAGGGNTFVNNIVIHVGDGGTLRGTTRHADAQSAQAEVDLLSQLARAKGVSI